MTNPTPEELKLVAEYMGHEAFIEGEPCHESVELIVDADKDSTYNPLTNAEQSRELEKMLLGEGWIARYWIHEGRYYIYHDLIKKGFAEESLELTIFNAALSHITATQGKGQ